MSKSTNGDRFNVFHVSQLEDRLQYDSSGKLRKEKVDLKKCRLQELVQYDCDVLEETKGDPLGVVNCKPLLRAFRRCANGLTVETTAWEEVIDENSTKT